MLQEHNSSACSGPQPRLLLIEDHAELAEVTALILREAGIDVRVAMSGKDALQEAAAWCPEMVLCDLTLPDIPGLEVVQTLRELPQTKNSLIAIHSMMSEWEIRSLEQNIRAGTINLVLSKPITEEKVERLLTNFAALRERRAASRT